MSITHSNDAESFAIHKAHRPFYINMFHMFVVAPLLLWVSYKLLTNDITSINYVEKWALLLMGAGVVIYHGWKTIQRHMQNESIAANYHYQINVLHFLFIGPVIAWVGYKLHSNKMPTDLEKITLFLLGGIAFLYHSVRAYQNSNH